MPTNFHSPSPIEAPLEIWASVGLAVSEQKFENVEHAMYWLKTLHFLMAKLWRFRAKFANKM